MKLLWAVVLGAAVLQARELVRFADADAAALFHRSRTAVSTGKGGDTIASLRMTGRLRIPSQRDAPIDGTVDIRILLPDRYLRVDLLPSGRRVAGFAGRTLLATTPGMRRADAMRDEHARLVRLMLGAAVVIPGGEEVTVRSTDEEAFPDTRTLDVTAGAWTVRFVADASSAMPLRLVFWGGGRGTTITSFADRRDVGGFRLPYRITTTTAERVLESLMFDEIQVNPPLTAADFTPPL